jgi:hypothetical protein
MGDETLPSSLTLDQAFRAAYFLTEQCVALEREPDLGLVLYEQYLHLDPARWDDRKKAVRRALSDDRPSDPLSETSTAASRSERTDSPPSARIRAQGWSRASDCTEDANQVGQLVPGSRNLP